MNPSFVLLYASAGLVTAARSTENSGKQHTDAYLPSRHPTALEPTLTPTAAAHSRSTAAPRSLQAIQADMQGAHWVDEKVTNYLYFIKMVKFLFFFFYSCHCTLQKSRQGKVCMC